MKNSTVAVLLAGGKSGRMGVTKGLLKYNNTFWILEQIKRLSRTTIKEVYVGLGYNIEQYFSEIDWFEKASKEFVPFSKINVKVIINPHPELGSFSTLQTVLKKIPAKYNTLICPIDVPILNVEELNQIINSQNKVVIPCIQKRHGHPIKIDSTFISALTQLSINDMKARLDFQIKNLEHAQISFIDVIDDSVLKNLNTPKEWKAFLNES